MNHRRRGSQDQHSARLAPCEQADLRWCVASRMLSCFELSVPMPICRYSVVFRVQEARRHDFVSPSAILIAR